MSDKKLKRDVRNASYKMKARRRHLKVLLRELEGTTDPGEVFALSREVVSLAEQLHRIGIRLEASGMQDARGTLQGTIDYLSKP